MDSQNLKQRVTGEDSTARNDVDDKNRRRQKNKGTVTKRGITSLTAALSIPLTLTVIAITLASSNTYSKTTASKTTPFWFPAPWFLHTASAASAMVMGLAAWLVWAKGGFHVSPTALYLYMTQFVLGLVWDPLVFGSGSSRVGLVMCAGTFGSLVGCHQAFKEVNPLAAELVKPCLAWTAFLGLVNLTLVYL